MSADFPKSYAYTLQKPEAQILVTQIKEGLEYLSINEFIEAQRQAGNYLEHMSYGPDGLPVVNHKARNSLRIAPDMRIDLTVAIEQVIQQYWKDNFEQREGNTLICTQSEFFYYPPGIGILLHTDDHVMTSTGALVGEDLYRGITSLLYLNDDYEGGEIEFPNQNLTLKPKPGTLVVFPSNRNFPHRVNPILSGHRNSFQRVYGISTPDGDYRALANQITASCC